MTFGSSLPGFLLKKSLALAKLVDPSARRYRWKRAKLVVD